MDECIDYECRHIGPLTKIFNNNNMIVPSTPVF